MPEHRWRALLELKGWALEVELAPYWLGFHWWPRTFGGSGLVWDVGRFNVELRPPRGFGGDNPIKCSSNAEADRG